ncbi:hypothetical protein LSAT2_003780, partial [Lamellibrachia satsuma]
MRHRLTLDRETLRGLLHQYDVAVRTTAVTVWRYISCPALIPVRACCQSRDSPSVDNAQRKYMMWCDVS